MLEQGVLLRPQRHLQFHDARVDHWRNRWADLLELGKLGLARRHRRQFSRAARAAIRRRASPCEQTRDQRCASEQCHCTADTKPAKHCERDADK